MWVRVCKSGVVLPHQSWSTCRAEPRQLYTWYRLVTRGSRGFAASVVRLQMWHAELRLISEMRKKKCSGNDREGKGNKKITRNFVIWLSFHLQELHASWNYQFCRFLIFGVLKVYSAKSFREIFKLNNHDKEF